MKRILFSLFLHLAFFFLASSLLAPSSFAKDLSAVAISPRGAVLRNGSSLKFSAVCRYSDGGTDDCTAAGGVRWSVSRPSSMAVSSTGSAQITADPGANSFQKGFVMVAAGSQVDRATVYTQHAGDTWYEYMTPDYRSFTAFGGAVQPTTEVVGSVISVGAGVVFNFNGGGNTGQPIQESCNWTSSAANVATVDGQGHVTAVASGTADITCGRAGDARFGTSSQRGWVAPGNVLTVTVVNGGTSNATWYVRPDGGTPFVSASVTPTGQCDGKHDAAYPGTGVNQPCAMGELTYLYLDQVSYGKVGWMISGGDTVIVRQKAGGYAVGATQANGQPNCPGDAPDCYMPSIPSGSAVRHTRLLGENYASCHADAAKTKLLMDYGVYAAVNVKQSQFVDVSCLEITDTEQCAEGNFTNNCSTKTHFGTLGVLTSALSSMDNLSDLFIHGIAADGIQGALGAGVVIDHLHLRAMPSAGINMDDDPWGTGNISVAGGLALTNSLTEFTGCVEEYPIVHNYPYVECRDQSTGGYGDGLGTASTNGDWLFDHDVWRYNFQDGLDLLHSGMHSLTVTNSQSYGNDGQQYKIGSGQTVIFANNIALHDCQRILETFGDEPASAIVPGVSACRAAGDGILLSMSALGSDTFVNNTYVGYGATAYDLFCEDGYDSCLTSKSTFRNNLNVALTKPSYADQLPGLFYDEISAMPPNGGWAVRDHNLFYNFRHGCPTLNVGEICADPGLLQEQLTVGTSDKSLDDFSFVLTGSSPAKYAGMVVPPLSIRSAGVALANVLSTDQFGTERHSPPSIGAVEVAGGGTGTPPGKENTTLSLAATPNPAVANGTVTLTAVARTEDGTTPTGTVSFAAGGSTLTATLDGTGTAIVMTNSLVAGSYVVTASYGGDTNFAATTASSVALTVTPGTPAPPSTVAISVAQPRYGFNVIPGSVRRVFAKVTNGTTNGVSWTVKSGGATVSASTGAWIDVTAPASASSCVAQRSGVPSITSATQFVVEASSADDPSKIANVTFNVCNPKVQVSIVPAYRTLYAGQLADLQSLVVGSVTTGVTWAITSGPEGGDGVLADTGFRDTVFSASVAGRYGITATSKADQSTVASTTMYVTGNPMPYPVTKSRTEPVDCSVDPALSGVTYEVGPSQAYHRLEDVPMATLLPGSTIRVHNEDTTGQAPTTYHAAVQITTAGTADQPIRLCGVPDSVGNLPILDGANAVAHAEVGGPTVGRALVAVGGNALVYAGSSYRAVENVAIEGVHLRNARAGLSVSGDAGTSAWSGAAACVLVQGGHQISVTGVEMEGCARGGQSVWMVGQWSGSSLNHLWEGNYLHGNGSAGSNLNHQLSLQGWGEVVQFNTIDGMASKSAGDNLRSDGVLDVIRYNYLGDGAARTLDLTEVQAGTPYLSFESFLEDAWLGRTTADSVAAWQEALHAEFVYGNTYVNGSSAAPIHFGYDGNAGERARKGDLYWYNNTFHQTQCPTCHGRPWTLFDQSGAGGTYLTQVEFPTVVAFNNIVWTDGGIPFQWNDFDGFIGVGGSNLLPTGWGLNTKRSGVGDGWNDDANPAAYQGASNLALHVTGFDTGDLVTTSTEPFDSATFLLAMAEPGTSALPAAVCEMPTRFAFLPEFGYAVARSGVRNIGAEDMETQATASLRNRAREVSASCQ